MIRIQGSLVLMLALSVVLALPCQAQQNRAKLGEWATNGEVSMRVTRVENVTDWAGLGKLIRFGRAEEQAIAPVRKTLEAGEAKFVLLTIDMRNDSKDHRSLGWKILGGNTSEDFLYLRGEEGTLMRSAPGTQMNSNTKSWGSRSDITTDMSAGLPMDAKVAPKTVVSGKVAFFVKDWFVPAVLYTMPEYNKLQGFGKPELIIKLK